MTGLAYAAASYLAYFYVGGLLMRLVVVQPVKDGSAVRWCFASTFALSLSLFTAVLVDMAEPRLFASAAAAEERAAGAPRLAHFFGLLHPVAQVNARAFTWILLALLLTVTAACPVVLVWSCMHHVLSRGQRAGHGSNRRHSITGGPTRGRSSSRRSSGAFSASRRGSGRQRTESPFSSRVDWSDGKQSQRRRRRRAALVLLLVLILLAAAGLWATRTHRLDPRGLRHTAVSSARRFYASARSRAAALRVPQEIGKTAVEDLADAEEAEEAELVTDEAPAVTEAGTPPPLAAQGGAEEKRTAPAEGGNASPPAPPTAAPAPPPAQPMPRETKLTPRRLVLPVVDVAQTISVLSLDLHALVCALTSRVAIVGVAMIGLLSGYAAITSPFLFLAPYAYWRGREEELRRAQANFTKKLCYVLGGYGAAQRQIASLQYAVLHEEYAASGGAAAAGGPATPFFASAQTPGSVPGYAPSTAASSVSGYASVLKDGGAVPYYASPAYPGCTNAIGAGGVDSNANVGFTAVEGSPVFTPAGRPSPLKPQQLQAGRATAAGGGGAVGWLQQKLSSAANAVVGRERCSPTTPGSGHGGGSPAQSRQFAVSRIRKLRGEAAASRFLALSLYLQLNEVAEMLREAQRGSTWIGRWYAALGAAMALYSAVKIGLTVASLWLWKASTQDPVTRAVSLLEDAFILRRHDGTAFSVTAVEVSTHVILALALAVNGWMVVNSIRGALLALFHVTMSFSGSAVSRPETVAVALSMLIGVYFVGQLVLLRSSLPGSSSRQLEGATRSAAAADLTSSNVLLAVLGSLPYYYYQRLNDWCFVVGCCGAVLVRRFVMRDAVSAVVYTASGGEER